MARRSVDLLSRPADDSDPSGADPVGVADRRHLRWLVAGATALVCVPLVVAVIGFRRPPWSPVLDLAMTELRVRDVGGRHTPLIGLPGRIGTLEEQGSHPGPLSFYALAPTYRLLGSTAWALQVATVVIHATAIAMSLWLAARRGGAGLVVAMAALLVVLTAGYGGGALTEPWNPYLPLLWWVVVLLAVWSVLCGDLLALPVAVLAASFCAQTHVPYLGLTLGLGALTAAAAAYAWSRHPERRGSVVRWAGAALALGALLWLPPTIDQVRNEPGNYRMLVDHFSSPDEETEGLRSGIEEGLRYFDVVDLVAGDVTAPGSLVADTGGQLPSPARGAGFVALWAASAVVAWRRGPTGLVALHAVVGAGLVLMVLAISRIFGVLWYYLTLWGWAIGLLGLLAAVWTLGSALADRWGDERRRSIGHLASVTLALLAALMVVRFSVAAWSSRHADATVAAELTAVIDDTAAGLDAEEGAATGHDGRYLITWSDAFHIGSQGYGMLNELERRGFDVAVAPHRRVPATAHRVLDDPTQATARVHLATGAFVETWRQVPGVAEIASFDPRSEAGRVEQERLRAEVIATLRDLDLEDLVPEVDDNLFGAAIDGRVPAETRRQMGRMLEIGAPLSVFVVPPGNVDP